MLLSQKRLIPFKVRLLWYIYMIVSAKLFSYPDSYFLSLCPAFTQIIRWISKRELNKARWKEPLEEEYGKELKEKSGKRYMNEVGQESDGIVNMYDNLWKKKKKFYFDMFCRWSNSIRKTILPHENKIHTNKTKYDLG